MRVVTLRMTVVVRDTVEAVRVLDRVSHVMNEAAKLAIPAELRLGSHKVVVGIDDVRRVEYPDYPDGAGKDDKAVVEWKARAAEETGGRV